jgi:hypothetical protein
MSEEHEGFRSDLRATGRGDDRIGKMVDALVRDLEAVCRPALEGDNNLIWFQKLRRRAAAKKSSRI